jgi:anti-anti-sigma factor
MLENNRRVHGSSRARDAVAVSRVGKDLGAFDEPVRGLVVVVEPRAEATVVRLQGDLDLLGAGTLRRMLDGPPAIGGPLEFDLAGLEFLDCAGLAALVEAERRAAGDGHTVRLAGATGEVRRLLALTGLDGASPPEQSGPAMRLVS